MRTRSILYLAPVLATVAVVAFVARAGRAAPDASVQAATDATARIVAAAQEVLKVLDDAGKKKVQFPLEGPQKTRWSNLPSPMFQREGLKLADLTAPQKATVMNLLTVALSKDGYRKVTEIMKGDEVLRTGGGGRAGGPQFGENEYYLAFLGAPSTTAPWLLQFGGHHLAINLTLAGRNASMTPSLPAAQPAAFTIDGREIRPLGRETDKGLELINALDEKQRSQAILPHSVSDLVLPPGQDGKTIQPEGLRASAMTPAQQNMLLELAREWAGIVTDGFANARMAEIKANLAQTYFAWSGPTTKGSVAYFRIQGPTLVIEYAPQKTVDHIHTIYRDPTNDYGAKFVAK